MQPPKACATRQNAPRVTLAALNALVALEGAQGRCRDTADMVSGWSGRRCWRWVQVCGGGSLVGCDEVVGCDEAALNPPASALYTHSTLTRRHEHEHTPLTLARPMSSPPPPTAAAIIALVDGLPLSLHDGALAAVRPAASAG